MREAGRGKERERERQRWVELRQTGSVAAREGARERVRSQPETFAAK